MDPAWVDLVKRWRNTPHAELELRIGHGPSRNVSQSWFQALASAMQKSPHQWDHGGRPVTESFNTIIHSSELRGRYWNNKRPEFFDKKLLISNVSHTHNDWSCRLALSEEKPLPAPTMPLPSQLVRVQMRHSFTHKNYVRYDLTEVVSGPTVQAAIDQGQREFEVELELLRTPEALAHTDAYLAQSLHLKALELLLADGFSKRAHVGCTARDERRNQGSKKRARQKSTLVVR